LESKNRAITPQNREYHRLKTMATTSVPARNDGTTGITSTPDYFFCQTCGKPCNLQCGKCKLMWFCNRECQKILWKSHKALCNIVSDVAAAVAAAVANPSATPICLLVDGMGSRSPGGYDVTSLRPKLERAGLVVSTFDASEGSGIPAQIATLLDRSFPQVLVMMAWGAGKVPLALEFVQCQAFRESLVAWVQRGGRLLVQGQLVGPFAAWPSWFDRPWYHDSYYRVEHDCSAAKPDGPHWCDWYKSAPGAVLDRYNVKAMMLGNVDPSEALFASTDETITDDLDPFMAGRPVEQGKAAVAFAKHGAGTISFFGDLEHEDSTQEIMAVIARGH
jgi:hypothetical protein